MNIQEPLEELKKIQENILNYIENDEDSDSIFQELESSLKCQKIGDDKHKLKLILCLLLNITNNHHHEQNFFDKLFQIFQLIKKGIQQNFSNTEIFKIFKSSKRILLFLIEENMMTIESNISDKMLTQKYKNMNYPEYFYPEIKKFLLSTDRKQIKKKLANIINNIFNENRKIGENDNKICKMIRDDSVEDFISFINQSNLPLNGRIKTSIFETNRYLSKLKETSLIEYAAFFGSFQIFQYLILNKVKVDQSIWLFAIHGKNAELIHLLEENRIYCPNEQCFDESILCHHNDIANYILNNSYLRYDSQNILKQGIKKYNFAFIRIDLISQFSFYLFCQYDYYEFVDILIKDKGINVNKIEILLN